MLESLTMARGWREGGGRAAQIAFKSLARGIMARERCVPACRASHSQSGKQISSKAFPGWSPHAFEASTTGLPCQIPPHLSASMTKTAPRENIQTALGENIRAFSSSSGGSSDNDKPPGDEPRMNNFIRLKSLADQIAPKRSRLRQNKISKLKSRQPDVHPSFQKFLSKLNLASDAEDGNEAFPIVRSSVDQKDHMESINQAYEKLLDVYAEGFDEDDIQEVLDFFPSSDLKRQAMQSERIKELWLKHGVKFGIESQRLDEIWETIDESGFTVVVDGSTSPPVAYTVGLSGGFGFGFEILFVGSDSESLIGARSIIRQCVNELEEKFGLIDVPDDLRLDRRIDGRKVALKEAKDSKYVNEKYARLADLYVKIHNPDKDSENMSKIMQIVISDENGRFPWDTGFREGQKDVLYLF